MTNLPIINLPAAQIGPLGITFTAPDAGGGNGQTARTVPIWAVKWLDERQTCVRVLQFVHHGQTPDLAGCPQYQAGRCARGGACLFHEDSEHPTWSKAAGWRFDPVTGCAVPQSLWAEFGLIEVGP